MVGTSVVATGALWCYALNTRRSDWTVILLPMVATPAVVVGGLIVGILLSFGILGSKNTDDGLLVSAWPVLVAGGIPGGLTVATGLPAFVAASRVAVR